MSRRASSIQSGMLTIALGAVFGVAVSAQQPQQAKTDAGQASTPQQVSVAPSTVKVTLTADGETRELISSEKTIKDLLKEHNIGFGDQDRCSNSLSSPLKEGMRIFIARVRSEVITERTPLPFKTREVFTAEMGVGQKAVKTPGKEGERVKTLRVYYKDGKVTARVKLADKVTPPQEQVVAMGVRGMTLASRGSFGGRRILELVATGYGPHGNGRWGMQTAMGIRPRYGIVAVDPRIIPLGTRLYVEGYGPALAADTGSAIKGMRIDLFFPSESDASQVGRRKVRVLIMD